MWPSLIQPFQSLSTLLLSTGRFKECSTVYTKLGYVYYMQGNKQSAFEYWTYHLLLRNSEACKLDKDNWQACANCGFLLKENGHIKSAAQMLVHSAQQNRTNSSLYFEAAALSEAIGDDSKAIEMYSMCLHFDKNILDWYFGYNNL